MSEVARKKEKYLYIFIVKNTYGRSHNLSENNGSQTAQITKYYEGIISEA